MTFLQEHFSVPFIALKEQLKIITAVFNRVGDKVLIAAHDSTARIFDAATGECLHIFNHGNIVLSAVFNGAEDKVLTTSTDHTARI